MHPVRIGRIVRTLRRRRGWRQVDLGARARVSQQAISLVETGRSRLLSIDTLDRILRALDAEIELVVRWRGGELDKVLDAGHATLEGMLAEQLARDGWRVELEVTYAIGGDRGSVDLLAFHPDHAALLIAEIKSDVTSADATLRRHDEKVRLGAKIARERYGWVAATVSRLLVLPDASTPRRRVHALAGVFDRVYPARAYLARRWLRDPVGPLAGILFLSSTKTVGARQDLAARRRVSRPRNGPAAADKATTERDRSAARPRTTPGFIDSTGEHQDAW